MSGIGAFAGGLASGFGAGANMVLQQKRDERDDLMAGLQRRNLEADVKRKEEDDAARKQIEEAGRKAFQQSLSGTPGTQGPDDEEIAGTPANPFGERGAMIDGAMAMAGAAMRAGKMDLARQHLEGAANLRTQMRSELAGEAYSRLKSTGDPSALIQVYNNLWPDGGKIDPASFKVTDDGKGGRAYALTFVNGDKQITKTMTEDELAKQVAMMADPKQSLQQDLQMSAAKALQMWKWNNDPETKPGGIKEREVKVKEEANAGLKDLRTAQADYYRGAKTQLTMAQAGKTSAQASGAEGLTPRQRMSMGRELANVIDRELSPIEQTDANGTKTKMPHPLRGYSMEIKERAERLIDEGDSPNSAIATAMRETRQRVEGLTEQVNAAFALADKQRGWLAGDAPLRALRKGITALQEAGFKTDEIKSIAKQSGRDPSEIDKALALKEPEKKQATPYGQSRREEGLTPRGAAPAAPAPGGRPPLSAFGGAN